MRNLFRALGRLRNPFRGNRAALAGAVVLAGVLLIALVAPWIAPLDTAAFDLAHRLEGPGPGHLLGLDEEGRDVLSQVIHGARISLGVSLLSVTLATLIGILIGLAAGTWGGRWDQAFVFVTDVVLAFPSILLIIALAAFQRESGFLNLVGILAAVGWVGTARLVRGQALSLKERAYVSSAIAAGASVGRIWFRHLVPNLIAPVVVNATFAMAGVIVAESTLSFLGLGLPPGLPSWGRLLDQGVQYLLVAPHLSVFPGIAIASLVLGFNLVGDGLRDALDVREIRKALTK